MEKLFESASKGPITTAIPSTCSLLLGIALIILSILQSFPRQEPHSDDSLEYWTELCEYEIIEYLSPFHFKDEEYKNLWTCPWRLRNTVYRITLAAVATVGSIATLIVLFSGKFEKAWSTLYWSNWFFFVLFFVGFVLDCDGINTGLNACKKEFTIEDLPLIYVSGIAQDSDTSSTSSFGSGWTWFWWSSDFDWTDYAVQVEECYITPFIWTALCDLFASVACYIAYRISKYYIFDPTERRMTMDKFKSSSASNNTISPQSNATTTSPNNGQATATQMTASNGATTKKQDSPDPFAEYHGGYELEPNTRKSTAAGYDGRMSAYDE